MPAMLQFLTCWSASWFHCLASSQVLKRPIDVYAAGLPTVTLGEEFKSQSAPLQVGQLAGIKLVL